MKNFIYILLISLSFTACEDVIDLELNTAEPRLVIDASLNWFKGTEGKNQFIKLSLSAPFYDNEVPPANNAIVTVVDTNNNTFNFVEDGDTGIYRNNTFIPEIDGVYNLTINYKDEIYTGTEQLTGVASIDRVEQKNDGGFSGEEIEIKAYYTDPEGIENYYLFEVEKLSDNDVSLEVYDDEFTDGNEIFAFYSDEDLEAGDELTIYGSGISERFYEFMVILLQQTDEEGGDPFETQPATVRGNCVNITNPENYPFGYFRASEVSIFNYIVKLKGV
ncbi:DUF4249 family protein [Algibacter sp. L1A34]|uniref:DUF4249 family protein n=1 Tax=Algibacter sp. L1A34 TaxID=2686365 RepID=UPI00131E2B82|nr:DUF4249 family protein [Algibacter sp. L1A34]